ncbi:hypothetical protein RUM43_001274 [Polyplax serrata]|uniref:Proton-coupled folate transporter n=1 Tax=Polyplax serrata TaxID=468196 RepID=A0AAN8SDK7_POLSC
METIEPNMETEYYSHDTGNKSPTDNAEVTIKESSKSKWCGINVTIEPLLFALTLADGLGGPVATSFIIQTCCRVHYNYNETVCQGLSFTDKNDTDIEALVQPYASVIITGMNILSVFFPVIISLFLGAWSDKNGRKLLLTIPTIGFGIKYLILAIFSLIPNLHPTLFLISVIPIAITGGFVNFITAAYAYICDISEKQDVSIGIGILEGFMLIGAIVGNLLSPHLFDAAKEYCYLLTFSVCATITFVGAVFNHFFIKESLKTIQADGKFKDVFDINLLKDMFRVCFKKRDSCGRAVLFLVILSLTGSVCAMEGESNLRFLYMRLKFSWNIEEFTKWISFTYGINFLGFLIGSIVLVKWLRLSDAVLGIISTIMFVAGDLFMAFVPSSSPHLVYYEGVIKLFTAFYCPAARALLSKSVPEEDLGKVFALTTASESVLPLAFTPLYTLLYNSTIDTLPGAFYILSSTLYMLSFTIFVILYYIIKVTNKSQYDVLDNNCEDQ